MDRQRLALADDLIAAMPERRRTALLLHRVEGLTHTQIALRLCQPADRDYGYCRSSR
ncbi:MAG: sigma-70 region 4 domain-containing protein [Acidobacteria bacterium]|nr:sigma-70 region 4 domain-containing protein [Acidobacteriota bacterium]